MFDQEIMDDFLHDVELITACLVDKDPDATMKGAIQIVGNKQFYFGKLRAWYFFVRHNAPPRQSLWSAELNHLFVLQTGTAEYVQGGADGDIKVSLSRFLDQIQVRHRGDPAGIGDRDGSSLRQKVNQSPVHPHALALNIHSMDKKLIAVSGKLLKHQTGNLEAGELLPAIGNDIVVIIPQTAAEIKNKPVTANQPAEITQTFFIKEPVMKNI